MNPHVGAAEGVSAFRDGNSPRTWRHRATNLRTERDSSGQLWPAFGAPHRPHRYLPRPLRSSSSSSLNSSSEGSRTDFQTPALRILAPTSFAAFAVSVVVASGSIGVLGGGAAVHNANSSREPAGGGPGAPDTCIAPLG